MAYLASFEVSPISSDWFIRRSLKISLLLDLCMEEITCHGMVINLSQRFSSMLCLFYFLYFFISFKYDFHVDDERMIFKTREM